MAPNEFMQRLMDAAGYNPNSLSAATKNKTKQPQIYRYIKGISREPKRSTLEPVAKVLGVPVDAFFDEKLATDLWITRFSPEARERESVIVELKSTIADIDALPDYARNPDKNKKQSPSLTGAHIGGLVSAPLDHGMSDPEDSNAPLCSREKIVNGPLPELYRVTLWDASLSPDLLPGDELVIERDRKPETGDLVIVRDADNNLYVREYRARGAVWSAHAKKEAFDPLRSDSEELQILGVSIAERRKGPRSRRA